MKDLKDILYGVAIKEVIGDTSASISGLAFDSRKIQAGFCYIAQKGTQVDGHDFITTTIQAGAVAIICEKLPDSTTNSVVYIKVDNSSISHSTNIVCLLVYS